MLYVKKHTDVANSEWETWHVGEKLPLSATKQRVVMLQADGDELEVILHALKQASSNKE